LPIGLAKLKIKFEGILNDKLKGFYRSKYLHPSGQEKYAATTQFEV
jgi:puromycin-sensitive aminopeptidase